jgi:menaquinol-cytochrome c reductase cytochrome b subunit
MGFLSTIAERLSLERHYRRIFERKLPPGVTYWYCFGGISFFLFLVLTFTGIILSLYYVPSASEAYATIRFIDEKLPTGWLMRSLHIWSASGMVVAVLVHMLRVYVTGSYKNPREFNWVVGMTLFVITMAFGFSGYLLPWDQKAFWATTVGTAMPGTTPVIGGFLVKLVRGGEDVAGITLLRFYIMHVFLLPTATIMLLWAHFHMIRRQGISGGL